MVDAYCQASYQSNCASSVTASITFGGSQLVLAAITLWNEEYVPTGTLLPSPSCSTWDLLQRWISSLADRPNVLGRALRERCCQHTVQQVRQITGGIRAGGLNLFPLRHLEKLNTVCLYWTGASVIM